MLLQPLSDKRLKNLPNFNDFYSFHRKKQVILCDVLNNEIYTFGDTSFSHIKPVN